MQQSPLLVTEHHQIYAKRPGLLLAWMHRNSSYAYVSELTLTNLAHFMHMVVLVGGEANCYL